MSVDIHKGNRGSCGEKKSLLSLCLPWWVATGKRGGGVGKGDNRILCCRYKSLLSQTMWQAAQSTAQLDPVLKGGSPCSCWWRAGVEEAGSSLQLWDSGKANLRDSKLGEMGEESKEMLVHASWT